MPGHFKLRNGGRRRRLIQIVVTAECQDPADPYAPVANEMVNIGPGQAADVPYEFGRCMPTVFHVFVLVEGGAYTFALPVEFEAPPRPDTECLLVYANPAWPAPPQQMTLTLTCPGMEPPTVVAHSY